MQQEHQLIHSLFHSNKYHSHSSDSSGKPSFSSHTHQAPVHDHHSHVSPSKTSHQSKGAPVDSHQPYAAHKALSSQQSQKLHRRKSSKGHEGRCLTSTSGGKRRQSHKTSAESGELKSPADEVNELMNCTHNHQLPPNSLQRTRLNILINNHTIMTLRLQRAIIRSMEAAQDPSTETIRQIFKYDFIDYS